MLLKKFAVYSRKNKLYLAFRELGRVVRTIFLLEYCNNKPMRKKIGATTTKIESFHAFRIISLMKEMRDNFGTTFIFSTHDSKVVENTETIFTLEDGLLQQGNNKGDNNV